jgi:outer membrane protein assembly factor BamB
MATLEVHDGQGQVQRVAITREQTVLFGASPKCDIVLNGPGVLPFHGRLRWKSTRFKVDASPDAGYLEVNGQRLASSSFRQGDEITVGPCRIFMIHSDEDLPPEPADDKTRIQPLPERIDPTRIAPPPTAGPDPAREPKSKPRERRKRRSEPAPPAQRRGATLEQVDWMKDLEVMSPSDEMPVVAAAEGRAAPAGRASTATAARPMPARGLGALVRALRESEVAPGQERILTSPLVFALAVSLALLVVLGFALNEIIMRTVAARLYQRAVESYEDGDYRNAARRFEEYLGRKKGDAKKTSQARVLRALAEVRQFTSTTGASWSNALDAERQMVETVGREPAYRDSSTELAELVVKTGEALADRARTTGDAKVLAEAEAAVALHARIAGEGAPALLGRSRLPAKLTAARAAVRKQAVRVKALAAMDEAIKARSPTGVYAARDALVRQYADLAEDRELVKRMTAANELIRRAVTFDSSVQPAVTEPHPEPFGPATSLVLRLATAEGEPPGRSAATVLALADGYAYGLDGRTGAPLWQAAVGLSSPFPPVAVPGGTSVLAFDARYDELVRIDAKTGKLLWRQALGERITDPPLVLGNQLVQTTPGGKLLLIDLPSGEIRGTFQLGLPLARKPVSDETGQYLYVAADKDCLFVVTRDPPACVAVEYLGHAAGSIPCAPARVARFLVIPENQGLYQGRWRVCVLEEGGARVRPVQQVAIPGWTWDTPAASGSVIWSASDRGAVEAYAVGGDDAPAPFRRITGLDPAVRPTGPAFALAKSEHELWLSGALPGRYELDLEKGALQKASSLAGAGPAVAPVQTAGGLIVLTQQFDTGPGVSLWGIEPQSGSVRWQTVLGAPWPTGLAATPRGEGLTGQGPDGRTLALTADLLARGGFVEAPLPGPGKFRLPRGPVLRLEGNGFTVLVPGTGSRHLQVRTGAGAFRQIDLPTALGAAPLVWGRDVLVPGSDGRAYLIDPATGESRAEPFVPVFDRAHPTRWRAPVLLDADSVVLADEGGKIRRMSLVNDPRPRLVAAAEVSLGASLLADPAATAGAVVVATSDGRVRSLSARDLSPVGAWPLAAPLADAPASVDGHVFVADIDGGILALGGDGQRLWSSSLAGSVPYGPPLLREDSVWFLARDGSLRRHSLKDGTALDRIDLNLLPAGPLRTIGGDLVVAVGNGTVRPVSPTKDAGGTPSTAP